MALLYLTILKACSHYCGLGMRKLKKIAFVIITSCNALGDTSPENMLFPGSDSFYSWVYKSTVFNHYIDTYKHIPMIRLAVIMGVL